MRLLYELNLDIDLKIGQELTINELDKQVKKAYPTIKQEFYFKELVNTIAYEIKNVLVLFYVDFMEDISEPNNLSKEELLEAKVKITDIRSMLNHKGDLLSGVIDK